MDSLDRMDIVAGDRTQVLVPFIESRADAGRPVGPGSRPGRIGRGRRDPAPATWTAQCNASRKLEVLGKTIPEVFVRRMLNSGGEAAVVDEFSGLLSYRKLLTACLLFGRRFAKVESERIGVMLPSSTRPISSSSDFKSPASCR